MFPRSVERGILSYRTTKLACVLGFAIIAAVLSARSKPSLNLELRATHLTPGQSVDAVISSSEEGQYRILEKSSEEKEPRLITTTLADRTPKTISIQPLHTGYVSIWAQSEDGKRISKTTALRVTSEGKNKIPLKVLQPISGATLMKGFEVSGLAEPFSEITVEATDTSRFPATANGIGSWSTKVNLPPGTYTLQVRDSNGSEPATIEVTVTK